MPYIPDNVSIISLSSDSSDDEDPDIMTVISGKKSDRIATYKSARRSSRLNHINNNNTITKNTYFQKPFDSKKPFDIKIPSVFKYEANKIHKINTRNENIKQEINKEEQELKEKYEKLQQIKARLVMELNDNGSDGLLKYDANENSSYIDSLIRQEINDMDKVRRNFYFLKNVEEMIFDFGGNFDYIPQSLLFLIARDPITAYNTSTIIKSDLRKFIMRALSTVLNPQHLISIIEMIKNVQGNVFTFDELVDFTNKFGGETKLFHENKMPLKINMFNNHLRMQLLRLTLLFNGYLIGDNEEQNLAGFLKLFFYVVSDYNANKREYTTLEYFTVSVFTQLVKKYHKSDNNEFVSSLFKYISGIETSNYGNAQETDTTKSFELCFNFVRLLNVAFTRNNDNIITDIIHKLNIMSISNESSLDRSIPEVVNELVSYIKLTDIDLKFCYKIKALIFILNGNYMVNQTRDTLNQIKEDIMELKKIFYSSMKKLTTATENLDLVMMVQDAFHQLEYLNNMIESFQHEDLFYNDI
ncbi:hypothetical protein L150_04319 [Candida albicans Ca529L]|nr:hypothetical protein L150_04319 [Candida albicans Ca529L]